MSRDPADFDPATTTDAQWRSMLAPIEYQILRHAATERPWTGRYLDNKAAGAYHCVGCGQHLYAGGHKFHSGCGWPSFFQAVTPDSVTTYRDTSHGMLRVEMRCAGCDGHLGHIFNDAPQTPTGMRHCVNGHALIFVPEGQDVADVLRAHRQSAAR